MIIALIRIMYKVKKTENDLKFILDWLNFNFC